MCKGLERALDYQRSKHGDKSSRSKCNVFLRKQLRYYYTHLALLLYTPSALSVLEIVWARKSCATWLSRCSIHCIPSIFVATIIRAYLRYVLLSKLTHCSCRVSNPGGSTVKLPGISDRKIGSPRSAMMTY